MRGERRAALTRAALPRRRAAVTRVEAAVRRGKLVVDKADAVCPVELVDDVELLLRERLDVLEAHEVYHLRRARPTLERWGGEYVAPSGSS